MCEDFCRDQSLILYSNYHSVLPDQMQHSRVSDIALQLAQTCLFIYLTFTMLWANSADGKLIYFYTDKIGFLSRQSAWTVQSYFLGKIRKIFQNDVCC